MKRIGSFLTLLAVGSLVFSPPTTRAAATTQSFDVTGVQTPANPCDGSGEVVTLQGSRKVTVGVTEDGSGGFHLSVHVNYQGVTGTGPSGITYEVPTTMNSNLDLGSANTLTITLTANVRVISHGSAPNFNLHENFHITINANNEITVLFDNFECG